LTKAAFSRLADLGEGIIKVRLSEVKNSSNLLQNI